MAASLDAAYENVRRFHSAQVVVVVVRAAGKMGGEGFKEFYKKLLYLYWVVVPFFIFTPTWGNDQI